MFYTAYDTLKYSIARAVLLGLIYRPRKMKILKNKNCKTVAILREVKNIRENYSDLGYVYQGLYWYPFQKKIDTVFKFAILLRQEIRVWGITSS